MPYLQVDIPEDTELKERILWLLSNIPGITVRELPEIVETNISDIAAHQLPEIEDADEALFEKLRQWRLEKAREENVSAYIIFRDRTLSEVANKRCRNKKMLMHTDKAAKPFLKWAGGKTQLIDQIKERLPSAVTKSNFTFVEPFAGSGAVLFWMLENFPNLKKAVINDVNTDLTNSYLTIKNDVNSLITILEKWEQEYHVLATNEELKKEYYYKKRTLFNTRSSTQTTQSALFIFLNRTCFNGLYRVNRKNEFNVPIGSYKTPQICNHENLLAVSKVLQRVKILNGDYAETLSHATKNTFFYFDPPYKPLSETSNFNSYAKGEFNDEEQIRLKEFCDALDKKNHQWILSNSDVKGTDSNNNFFDDLYSSFNILRVNASRRINSKASKRGQLTELLITNT